MGSHDDMPDDSPREAAGGFFRGLKFTEIVALAISVGTLVVVQTSRDERQDGAITNIKEAQATATATANVAKERADRDHDLLITTAQGVTYLVDQQKMGRK